jgi:hypothetical protein
MPCGSLLDGMGLREGECTNRGRPGFPLWLESPHEKETYKAGMRRATAQGSVATTRRDPGKKTQTKLKRPLFRGPSSPGFR